MDTADIDERWFRGSFRHTGRFLICVAEETLPLRPDL
jgi:hypothetical protein